LAKKYYSNVEFAFQLCKEIAEVESSNQELSGHIVNACKKLERIIAHNVILKSSDYQPAWPRHDALLRFDLHLHRQSTHFILFKKWEQCFHVLKGTRLYHCSNDKVGCFSRNSVHPVQDSIKNTLAFVRSNPAPDGRHCIDLRGSQALLIFMSFLLM
jgi:hypothetical protein